MRSLIIVFYILAFSNISRADDSMQELAARAQKAAHVLHASHAMPDSSIPRSLFDVATCVATIPNVIRAGFIFGGRFGKGLISCRVGDGWSNPVFLSIAGGSWGLQFGADSTDLILVFVNADAIQRVTRSHLELGAGISVAAGPLGREAAIGTDFRLESETYAYSRTRGLYAGLTIKGSKLSVNDEANELLYGNSVDAMSLLQANYSTAPRIVWPYVEALISYER